VYAGVEDLRCGIARSLTKTSIDGKLASNDKSTGQPRQICNASSSNVAACRFVLRPVGCRSLVCGTQQNV
jgi:hypothetical protein